MDVDGGYPRFSPGEMSRRRGLLVRALDSTGAQSLLAYGAERSGTAVQWLTQWPVTREAAVLWTPTQDEALLFVQFANHLDNARRMADGVEVRWGGPSTFDAVAEALTARCRAGVRLGTIGALPVTGARHLEAAGVEVVPLDREYRRLRLFKSEEELDWTRRGAELTDAGVQALVDGAAIGCSQAELGALVEAGYLGTGATTHIHYFATTAMARPGVRVPAQWPSQHRLQHGDVLSCEVSASWWGYAGQLLRTFTVDAEPTPLYRDLHDVADAAFAAIAGRVRAGATGAELAAAARLVEGAGFATCDDLVHGYVGGYFPPIVPGAGRPFTDGEFVLEAGMTVVVQPNIVTRDGAAGVQTGELLLVTEAGYERLHRFAPGIGRLG